MTDLFSTDALSALLSAEALTAFLQVVMIDLVLAGDNAIVIGLAAAGLPKDQRGKAILVGIIAATVLRIVFASVTVQLLQIIGLLLAGGVLLLWVCWKMYRELRTPPHDIEAARARAGRPTKPAPATARRARRSARRSGRSRWPTSRCRSTTCSRSPAPRASIPSVLIFGLGLSIALMGVAATFIAKLLQNHRWIA